MARRPIQYPNADVYDLQQTVIQIKHNLEELQKDFDKAQQDIENLKKAP